MIQVLAGQKGSGKTKRMISNANDLLEKSKGNIVYIGNNSEVMFELNSKIRLIDITHFPITSADSFIGFLCGLISEDYDIEAMFIDNLNIILNEDSKDVERFFENVKSISEKYSIKFYIGVRYSEKDMSQFDVEYIAI